MAENQYVFALQPVDVQLLTGQTARALEKRTELIGRAQYPKIWHMTDRLNEAHAGQTPRKKSKVRGAVFMAVGLFLLVPGLTDPKGLLLPLIAGVLALLRGLMEFKQPKVPEDRFFEPAQQLLRGLAAVEPDTVQVLFDDAAMEIREGQTERIPYEKFECAVESSDLWLLTFDDRVLVLQKKDLKTGHPDSLHELLQDKVKMTAAV